MQIKRIKRRLPDWQVRQKFGNSWINGVSVKIFSGTIGFDVYVDTSDYLPTQLLASPKLPQVGDLYGEQGSTIDGVFYTEVTPKYVGRRGSLFLWDVVYTLGGSSAESPTDSSSEEKDAVVLSFSVTTEFEDYASAFDLDGRPNVNTLGEWFAEPIVFKSGIVNLNFRRKEWANPLGVCRDFFQAVNSTPLWGFAAGTVKVADVSFTATQTATETTYDVDYKLQYRPQGWNDRKANSGKYYLYGGVPVVALNEDGSPVEDPVLLAADGTKLATGAAPYFLEFRTTYPKDLTELGLPDPFAL